MSRWFLTLVACLVLTVTAAAQTKVAVVAGNSDESRRMAQFLESRLAGVTLIERAQLASLYQESKLQGEALDVHSPDFLVLVQTHYQSRYNSSNYDIAATIKVVRSLSSEIVYATTLVKTVADRKYVFRFYVPQLSSTVPLNLDLSTTESAALEALAKDGAAALNAVFSKISMPVKGQEGLR